MADSLRDLIYGVIDRVAWETCSGVPPDVDTAAMADALLASPELKAIIDLAAWWTEVSTRWHIEVPVSELSLPHETYGLLTAWRAERP